MTPPDRPTITPELVERFRAYPLRDAGWGSLHVVLEDGNVETVFVEGAISWAEEHGDAEGAALARILLSMSRSQRGRIGRFADMPWFTTLDTWELAGRTAHVVDTSELSPYLDPRRLLGQEVWLDRRRVVVVGVETPALRWRGNTAAFEKASLLVVPRRRFDREAFRATIGRVPPALRGA